MAAKLVVLPVRATGAGISLRAAGRAARTEEPIGAWLTATQNELLARRVAGDAWRADPGAVDGCAGCRMLEIVAAILPIEWG